MSNEKIRRAWSVAVYPRHEGRVLLIRHRRLGVWLPPGGECEPGETPLEAARRELREETGFEGRFPVVSDIDGTPPGLIGYEEHVAGQKGMHLNFVFVADVDGTEVRPNDEFDEWRWVTSADGLEAPPNVGQLARVALAAVPAERAPLTVARRWLDAARARDVDALVGLYAEDAVHRSPKLRAKVPSGQIGGRVALRAYWTGVFARLPQLSYTLRALIADGDRVTIEYLREVPGEPPLEVAEVLDVKAGQIVASRVFHG
jgi:8-oxo-dGTP pyrophosphatase MutT (NUDIX family)/ketosteroid isomerase-like protein